MTIAWRSDIPQTGFMAWLRANPRLHSIRDGVVATDCDVWIHRYKTVGGREFQFLMLLEVKEHGKEISDTQRDTLHVANQLLRNRRNKIRYQADDGPRICKVYSAASRRDVFVCCFGVHLLTIYGDGTHADKCRMTWDHRFEINADQLEQLLLFELDPDDHSKLDHRPFGKGARHKTTVAIKDIEMPLGFSVSKPIVRKS